MQIARASDTQLADRLDDGLRTLGLNATASMRDRFLRFVDLLEKWNSTYNLTAVRTPEQMISRHLLDSLAVAAYVRGTRVLDIGTGAGLPGIPLALLMPERQFTLLDSNAKKTRFLIEAVAQLGLTNVSVVAERVEKYRPALRFDTLASRAFSGIAEMVDATKHLLAERGVFLAMKGVYPEEELAALPAEYRVSEVVALRVPGLDAARHVVTIVAV